MPTASVAKARRCLRRDPVTVIECTRTTNYNNLSGEPNGAYIHRGPGRHEEENVRALYSRLVAATVVAVRNVIGQALRSADNRREHLDP